MWCLLDYIHLLIAAKYSNQLMCVILLSYTLCSYIHVCTYAILANRLVCLLDRKKKKQALGHFVISRFAGQGSCMGQPRLASKNCRHNTRQYKYMLHMLTVASTAHPSLCVCMCVCGRGGEERKTDALSTQEVNEEDLENLFKTQVVCTIHADVHFI